MIQDYATILARCTTQPTSQCLNVRHEGLPVGTAHIHTAKVRDVCTTSQCFDAYDPAQVSAHVVQLGKQLLALVHILVAVADLREAIAKTVELLAKHLAVVHG